MKPSSLIFAFLLGGIVVAIWLGAMPLAILLTLSLICLIALSLVARAFRNRPANAGQTRAEQPSNSAPPK